MSSIFGNKLSYRVSAARSMCMALLLLAEGCGTTEWNRVELTPQSLGIDNAQIWSRGAVVLWRQVVITADSVTGVPAEASNHCHDCRTGLPRATVDSVVLSNTPLTVAAKVGVIALIGLALYLPFRPEFH